jgi:hypothetical protein
MKPAPYRLRAWLPFITMASFEALNSFATGHAPSFLERYFFLG